MFSISLFSEPAPSLSKIQKFVNGLTEAEALNLYIILCRGLDTKPQTLQSAIDKIDDKSILADSDVRTELINKLQVAINGWYLVLK